jgi:hypothetical protein
MSKSIETRLKRIEDKLNIGKKQLIFNIVCYDDGGLPPEKIVGGCIVRHIHYADLEKEEKETKSNGM